MGERIDPIVARLREQGAETAAFFRSLGPDDWIIRVYDDGPRWDVRQVLCHFVSAEIMYMFYLRREFEGQEGVPDDFSIDHFNAEDVARLDGIPPEDLLARFEQARAETIGFVAQLDDADLDREGRHPFFGRDKVEKFLKLIYRHNMIHERDVRRALGLRSDAR
jgi:hypothetical protein